VVRGMSEIAPVWVPGWYRQLLHLTYTIDFSPQCNVKTASTGCYSVDRHRPSWMVTKIPWGQLHVEAKASQRRRSIQICHTKARHAWSCTLFMLEL
jgi:hypothetical protein